ncbi:MAG: UDP-N-acetylmuramoyl-L-alanine--D-glutamate ligase [Thiomicrospira sp.]|nr:MAG: UDP-N-acetylmuramoyl-L-alanine--D-glutamate ligase [Thiomicrospira sp.]
MYLVAGLGLTGQSVLNYFASQGEACYALDTRPEFDTSELEKAYPDVEFATGALPTQWCGKIDSIVLSPGIPKSEPWVKFCINQGTEVIGDIELFARAAGKPIVAITGSNGKSTVTTLVAEALKEAGYAVGVGGNIGCPALDLLTHQTEFDVYVLELSSFQLETTYSLQTVAATVLNISEDHMDRYLALEDYIQAKMTILNNTELAVLPLDFERVGIARPGDEVRFGLNYAEALPPKEYGIVMKNGQAWLGWEKHASVPVTAMAQQGLHHQLNALAMMALCRPFELPDTLFEKVLKAFKGLPHRTQVVLEQEGICWINDSKGTNVGATVTAIESIKETLEGQVILIAGGVGKEADFKELGQTVSQSCGQAILFGQDKAVIAQQLPEDRVQLVDTLSEAVLLAKTIAKPGDAVLFSPACASFDQFKNYIDRGNAFEALVQEFIADEVGGKS